MREIALLMGHLYDNELEKILERNSRNFSASNIPAKEIKYKICTKFIIMNLNEIQTL